MTRRTRRSTGAESGAESGPASVTPRPGGAARDADHQAAIDEVRAEMLRSYMQLSAPATDALRRATAQAVGPHSQYLKHTLQVYSEATRGLRMAFEAAVDSSVIDRRDFVEVVGRSTDEVVAALRLLDAAELVRGQIRAETSRTLLEAIAAASAHPVTEVADINAAQRLAAHRSRLLQLGFETHESLAARRGSQASAARAWVARTRDAGTLFTVKHEGRTLIPAVQLTRDGRLDPAVSQLVSTLRPVGLDGWQLWGWLCSPSGWTGGEVPADVAHQRPEEALAAARAYAEELDVPTRTAVAQ